MDKVILITIMIIIVRTASTLLCDDSSCVLRTAERRRRLRQTDCSNLFDRCMSSRQNQTLDKFFRSLFCRSICYSRCTQRIRQIIIHEEQTDELISGKVERLKMIDIKRTVATNDKKVRIGDTRKKPSKLLKHFYFRG